MRLRFYFHLTLLCLNAYYAIWENAVLNGFITGLMLAMMVDNFADGKYNRINL